MGAHKLSSVMEVGRADNVSVSGSLGDGGQCSGYQEGAA